ncbi:endoplasmic reticulum-based factor for assembly of V-ATPase-domain-containing protein [Nemania sp. FL0916]|nr:endoplasmic reticulum-based factor for assembly of V-ATPase-domain-containing protein [Nemania sp. FL0916]
MVLLTMTSPIVEALTVLNNSDGFHGSHGSHDFREAHDPPRSTAASRQNETRDPCITDPAVGKPISHGQILSTLKTLQAQGHAGFRLDTMLRGSALYVPPPPPPPQPTDEYRELMARLRREEEERSYERMTRKAPPRETFADRFPLAPTASMTSLAQSFAEANRPTKASDVEAGDIEFGDVQKQLTLILNFLLSVFGCGVALWKLARWWPVSARLFISLGGALLVAITEVAVYSAYTWRMSRGEEKEKRKKETREVVQTWVVGKDGENGEEDDKALGPDPICLTPQDPPGHEPSIRKRRTKGDV